MQDTEKVINEVTTLVNWYKKLPKDYSNIEDLMYARKVLCGNMFMLSVELGKTRQQWKECEFTTESVRRNTMKDLLEEGLAVGKADAYARADSLLALEAETVAESYYHLLKFMIDATQEVNNTMMQHISTLKKERENSNQYT
jgi:hypothetical protein